MNIETLDHQVPKMVCTLRLDRDLTKDKMDLILLASHLTTIKSSLEKEITELEVYTKQTITSLRVKQQ